MSSKSVLSVAVFVLSMFIWTGVALAEPKVITVPQSSQTPRPEAPEIVYWIAVKVRIDAGTKMDGTYDDFAIALDDEWPRDRTSCERDAINASKKIPPQLQQGGVSIISTRCASGPPAERIRRNADTYALFGFLEALRTDPQRYKR
jgi:hypothetical protein